MLCLSIIIESTQNHALQRNCKCQPSTKHRYLHPVGCVFLPSCLNGRSERTTEHICFLGSYIPSVLAFLRLLSLGGPSQHKAFHHLPQELQCWHCLREALHSSTFQPDWSSSLSLFSSLCHQTFIITLTPGAIYMFWLLGNHSLNGYIGCRKTSLPYLFKYCK